ncbi:MAG: tetratricopeptide repeat protein [bacterium]|nr:tetratricopeptide repeat protein [bacterium]
MISDFAPPTPAIDPDLEWDRLRSYLRAETGPLAVLEVESQTQAEELVEAVRSECGDACAVEVYRPDASADGQDPRNVLEWLAARQTPGFRDAVFLVLGLGKLAADGERTREFWTWMDSQRERWRPAAGKLAFVLTPRQVDDLCRFAGALWDWIPLKFNLLRIGRAESLGEQERDAFALDRDHQHPGEAARLIPALREQLLMARQQGLPEAVIRREYAWPLFRSLTRAYHLREAAALLDTDLAGDFDAELEVADQLDWWLTVGEFSLKQKDLTTGEKACRTLIEVAQQSDDVEKIAAGYHHLGRIAQQRRDFDDAEMWYRKALAIFEDLGAEYRAAGAYNQLGITAQQRRDFDGAEKWYRKALAISEQLGDEHRAAITYYQLGRFAQERRDFDGAEKWYRKALAISEQLGDEHGTAITYHQLGRIAQQRRDFDHAEQWYRKSLAIKEKLGTEHGAAITYHQLGGIAQQRRDFANAEQWYRKALAIFEKLGDDRHADSTRGQLRGPPLRRSGEMGGRGVRPRLW